MKNENKKASWSSTVFGACLAALCCVSSAWAGVARIGGTEYDTLAAAFAAASNGDTVTLVSDATVPNEIAIDKTVTLDLATYRVTAAADANAFQVVSNGNFTVNADATNPGGITTDDDRCCVYTSWGWNPGPKTVTINNGSFDGNFVFNWASNIDPQAAAHYGVTAAGGGSGERAVPTTVVINGGVFDGGYENGNVAEYRCYYFTVNGGTFEKGLDSADTETCSIGVTSTCKAFFKGGKYKVRYPYWRETISGRESPAKIHIGDGYTDYIHIIDGDYYAIAPDATGCAVETRNAKKTDVYSTIRHLIYGVWQHWVDVQSDWYVKQSAGPSAGANNAVQTPPLHMMSAAPQLKSAAAPLASLATAAAGGEPTVYVNTDNGLVPVILQTYGAYYDAMPGDEALQNCDFYNNKFVDEKVTSDLLKQSDFDAAYVFSYKTAIDLQQLIPLVDDYLRPVDDAARSQLCEMLGLPDGSSDEIIQVAIYAAFTQPSPYANDPYLAWETDFVMSFDRPVAAGSVRYLWGRGSGVVDNIYANDALTAGTYKRVFDLSPLQPTWSGVVNEKKNNHIVIGLRNLSKENYGTTVTVSLRHRSPDGDDSKDVIRASYSMTFTDPSAPTAVAQVTIGGVTTKYADLHEALEAAKASGAVCELLSDVDLMGKAWTPVVNFQGTFDGKGYTISGLTVSGAGYVGLFASLNGATVKDLTISGANVTATGDKSGILAAEVASGAITNVKVVGSTITSSGEYVGGLFGIGYSAVSGCEIATCTIEGKEQTGGAIGYMWVGSIENCTATNNTVTAASRAGGLIGKVQFAKDNIGPVPTDKMWVNGNTVSGTVNGGDTAGGLTGQIMGDDPRYEIKNNTIDVALTGTAKNPVGNLRSGQDAAFTGTLAAKITGNTWSAKTYAENSYTYPASLTGAGDQTIWNGEPPVCKIVETGLTYKTLEAALDAVADGQTILLLGDVTTVQGYGYSKTFAATLDMNGKTLKVTGDTSHNHRALKILSGTLMVTNGTIDARNVDAQGEPQDFNDKSNYTQGMYGALRAENGGNLVLKDLVLFCNHCWGLCVKVYGGSDVQMDNVTVNASVGGGIEVSGGSATIRNSTFNQTGVSNYASYISTGIAVSCLGVVNVRNTGFSVEGHHAFYVYNSGGIITVDGGVFTETGTADLVHVDGATYSTFHRENEGFEADDTAAFNAFTSAHGGKSSIVQISNGAFTGKLALGGDQSMASLNITGGTFSVDPTAYVADGYEAVKGSTLPAYWTVQEIDPRAKGYKDAQGNYIELPTAPDMSGNVVNVTAANAQYTLDGAYGSIDGKTINFTESISDVLILGRPTKYVGSNTKYYSDFGTTEVALADVQNGYYYTRDVQNVTFTAAENVTLAGFYVNKTCLVGDVAVEGVDFSYDYVRDVDLNSYNNINYKFNLGLSNIKFQGLTLASEAKNLVNVKTTKDGLYSYTPKAFDGITFEGCTFNLGTATTQAAYLYDGDGNTSGTAPVRNIVFDGCTFNGCANPANGQTAILGLNIGALTVDGCAFNNLGRAIQEQYDCYGNLVITDNTFTGTKAYIIRLAAENTDQFSKLTGFTLTGNSSTDSAADTKIKNLSATAGYPGTGTCSVQENTWDANVTVVDPWLKPAVPVAQVTVGGVTTKYPTLAAALKAAESGNTIEILDGTWGADAVGTLTTSEANVVRYKSLTIQPAEGATVKFTSQVYLGYDDSSTANASMTVKNIAFENASLAISNYNQVWVEGCMFSNTTSTAGTLIIQDACCKNHKSQGDYPASKITIKDCVIDGSNTGASGIRLRNSGNVSITGCTVKNSKFNGILFESNGSVDNTLAKTVTVTGNAITEWNATNAEDGGRAIRAALGTLASGSVVTIEGNVFTKATTGLDTPDFIKMTEASNATISLEGNDWNNELRSTVSGNSEYYTVNGASPAIQSVITTKKEPVAEIVETGAKYSTLADAIGAVADGETIAILTNITATGWVEVNRPGIGFTIDLCGMTIERTDGSLFDIYSKVTFKDSVGTGLIKAHGRALYGNSGADFTLESGTVMGTDGTAVNVIGDYGSSQKCVFTMNGGTVTSTVTDAAINLQAEKHGAQFVMNGGTVNAAGCGISCWGNNEADSSTITINDGVINAKTEGISVNGSKDGSVIAVNGGAINGEGSCGIYAAHAKVAVTDGAITGTEAITIKGGSLAVSGGELIAIGAANDPAEPVSSGCAKTGDALYIEDNYYISDYSFHHTITVNITGGSFTAVNGNAISARFSATGKTPTTAVTVAGGQFKCANGKKAFSTTDFTGTISASGGIYSVKPDAAYIVAGKISAANPDSETCRDYPWAILTSYAVTFTADEGTAPDPTNYVLSATMTPLPKPTNQPDGLTFSGWLIPGLTESYMAIPSGTTGDLELTATWTAAQKIEVKETEASAEPTVEIKVTQEWIDENVTPAGEKPTTAEIQTELNKKDENGNLKWQNYVIGLDPTNNVAGVAMQNDDEKTVAVVANVEVPQADTGFTVKYSLDQVETNGAVIAVGPATTSDNLDIDLDGVESNAFFKVNVIVTKDGGEGEATKIAATNTLGVLKVTKAPATSIVAVPWDEVGGTAVTVANYVKTASLSEGDQLYVYTTNGTYSTWALDADKEWYSTGKEEKDPAEETIARGSAVWVKRQDSSKPLVLFGQASSASSSTSLDQKKSDTDPSWNIVAAPTVAPIDLNERFNADTKEGVTQDQVIVPTDGPPKNYTFVNGVWGYDETYTITNKAGKVIGKKVRVTDDSKIPAGTGFWYLNRGNATEVKW